MAILASKESNDFTSHKSTGLREYLITVMGFLLVAGYFYYDSYTAIKVLIGALVLALIAVIINF